MSRKLDAEIAEALGYEVRFVDEINLPCYGACKDYWTHSGDERWHRVPTYSTDGNAMLKLIEEMRKREWGFGMIMFDNDNVVQAGFNRWKRYEHKRGKFFEYGDGESKSMPMAVALAAYHALTNKEWTSID